MAYELFNNTKTCGKLKPLETNVNRLLSSRPPPERCEPFQPTEPKRNKREKLNVRVIENKSSPVLNVLKISENSAVLTLLPYENLPFSMNSNLPFRNASSINNPVSLFLSFIISTTQTYLNVPLVIYSNRINYAYTYSDTLLPTLSNFVFLSSEQIASKIIYFFVKASPHTTSNMLKLFLFDNMLNKHFKQPLISHRFILTCFFYLLLPTF